MSDSLKDALDSLMNTNEEVEKEEEEKEKEKLLHRFVFAERDDPNYPPAFILGDRERLSTELFLAADLCNRIKDVISGSSLFMNSPDKITLDTKPEFSIVNRALHLFMKAHAVKLMEKHGVELVSREEFEQLKEQITRDLGGNNIL